MYADAPETFPATGETVPDRCKLLPDVLVLREVSSFSTREQCSLCFPCLFMDCKTRSDLSATTLFVSTIHRHSRYSSAASNCKILSAHRNKPMF